MKNVAVVILSYNGAKYLCENLQSLRSQTFRDFDVIVVDNNSTDDSVKTVSRGFGEVRLIRYDSNLGFAAGYNRTVRFLGQNYEYAFLLNQDTVCDSKCLEELVRECRIRISGEMITLL